MKRGKRLAAAIGLSIMLACTMMPSVAFAAEHPAGGHIHVDVDVYHVPGDDTVESKSSYPAKWDPREMSWYQNNIQVKSQGYSNICWACAAASVGEISYALETQGAVAPMSPPQIAYFFYNRVNDPLGNTGGDKNIPYDDWNADGGSCIYTYQHLATHSGMIPDAVLPLSSLAEFYSEDPYRKPAPTYSSDLAYGENVLTLENSEYYPELPYTDSGKDTLKRLITEHGAAVVSIQVDSDHSSAVMDEGYFKDGDSYNAPFYKPDAFERNDHEVTIVGWDDNYSRDNFGSLNQKTGKYTAKPSRDGAWIMQNSWGTKAGEQGYYYISYESKDVLRDGIMSMDMEPAGTTQYLYQYDGNADYRYVMMFSGEKTANVFHAPVDHQIRVDQAGFTEYNDGKTEYVIDLYTGLSNPDDPTSGEKAMPSQTVTTYSPGYKTFQLNEPVTVDAGETWSIVITFKAETIFGSEGPSESFPATITEHQSYYFDDNTWTDAKKGEFCFRIKGGASDTSCLHDYIVRDTTPATKNAEGYTTYKCTKCGHLKRDDFTPMLDPVPEETKITSLESSKKALTVKWKKDSEMVHNSHITGYKIRYSTKSSMSGAKTVTVKGWKNTSKKLSGLKSKKKYYVQVQTYYKDSDGTMWYSDWSPAKSKKTK